MFLPLEGPFSGKDFLKFFHQVALLLLCISFNLF
jgi:hypothetical protein